MKKKSKISLASKYILMILSLFCIIMIFISFTTNISTGSLRTVSGYIYVPIQKGINRVGTFFSDKTDEVKSLREVMDKNEELKAQIDKLTIENSNLQQDKFELDRLRELYKLDDKYSSYNKVGARIIAKDTGNWFSVFLIDKGSDDGIKEDNNVMAGSGLVGIVTDVGPNWAKVRSIIDDASNVSAMTLESSDRCIVEGGLKDMNEKQMVKFNDLRDTDNKVSSGAEIITSNVSDKYLPGITIGYITEISLDSNNITKSGYITPVVDFEHLDEVLVITDLKEKGGE